MNCGGLSGQDEDARANDGADAKRDQVQGAERPLQFVLALFVRL